MIYTANITTVKNTARTALLKTVVRVTKGLVYKVEFYFPPGSAGLMGVAVFDGLYQVWPSTIGDFFVSDDETIRFDDMYLKKSAPYEFQCYSYNEDERFDHFMAVRIGLVSSDVFLARFMPTSDRQQFVKMRKRMEKDRTVRAKEQRLRIRETAFAYMQGLGADRPKTEVRS